MTKRKMLRALTLRRRNNVPAGFRCIGSFHNGRYESQHVVPWTKSASNVDADLMIVAQDWASEDFLNGPFNADMASFGYDKRLPTNRKLFELLDKQLGMSFSSTYATDVFPFVKRGNMSARIPFSLLVSAARDFCIPQIKIVNPKVTVCLGIATFNAVRVALGYPRFQNWRQYEENAGEVANTLCGHTEICAVTHLGAWSSVRKERIPQEWSRLQERLSFLCS